MKKAIWTKPLVEVVKQSKPISVHHRQALLTYLNEEGLAYKDEKDQKRITQLVEYLSGYIDETPSEWYEGDWYDFYLAELLAYFSPIADWDTYDDRFFAIIMYFLDEATVSLDFRRYLKENILLNPEADNWNIMCQKLAHLYSTTDLLERLLSHNTSVDTKTGVMATVDDQLTSFGRYVLSLHPKEILSVIEKERTVWYYARLLAFHAPAVLDQYLPRIVNWLLKHDQKPNVIKASKYLVATLTEVDAEKYKAIIQQLVEAEEDIVERFNLLVSTITKPSAENIKEVTALYQKAIKQKEPIEVNSYDYEELFALLDEDAFYRKIQFLVLKWILQHAPTPPMELIEQYQEEYSSQVVDLLAMATPYTGAQLAPQLIKALSCEGVGTSKQHWESFSKLEYTRELLQLLDQTGTLASYTTVLWELFEKEKDRKVREVAAHYLSRLPNAWEKATQSVGAANEQAQLLAISVIARLKPATRSITYLQERLAQEKKEPVSKHITQCITAIENADKAIQLPDKQRWLFDRFAAATLAACITALQKAKSQIAAPLKSLYFYIPEGSYYIMSLELQFEELEDQIISVSVPDGNFPVHIDKASSDKVLSGFRKRHDLKAADLKWDSQSQLPDAAFFLALSKSFLGFIKQLDTLQIPHNAECEIAFATHDEDPEPVDKMYQSMLKAARSSLVQLMLAENVQRELAHICFEDPSLQKQLLEI